MRVRALKYYYHDRQEHQIGDEFDMDDRLENEVKILCHLGTLERVRQPSSQSYQTRNMVAPPPVQAQQETSHPVEPLNTEAALTRRVNRYKRRDLKAEE